MVKVNSEHQSVTDNEVSPLLTNQVQDLYTSNPAELTYNSDFDDVQSKHDDRVYDEGNRSIKFSSRPFWWFFSMGIIALIILHLSFLPRTSLSRDFRRWHGLHLTRSDVQRNYLVYSGIGNSHESVLNEDHINWWLTNFSDINSRNPVNILADDNIELVSFIEKKFKHFGFKTEWFSYNVNDLKKPISSSIQLINSKTNDVIYASNLLEPGFKTPAYNGFGLNGTISANYIYVNEGTNKDYQLLLSNGIDPKGKIVIIKSRLDSNLLVSEKLLIAEKYGAVGLINYNDLVSQNNKENESFLNVAISRDNAAFGPLGSLKVPSIFSIPINLKSIKPILDTLPNNKKDESFKGWDHHPENLASPIKLEITSIFEEDRVRKLTNVVGSIKGILNDGDIIIGARRDSFTSANPLSSHAILLEIMRHFQRLIKLGWKPLRTIKFVSWDGSSNGLLGSQLLTNDTNAFDPKRPVIGYINIDGDGIMGSRFEVDSNPLFNHLLKSIAKYIPIPKKENHYRTLPDVYKSENEAEENYEFNDFTTLYHYWLKQDNNSINNLLGQQLIKSDSLIFQNHLNCPIINIKFENDVKRDSSIYIPNSNYYSYNWIVKRQIDNDLILHGSLIRYLGLLIISLSEHEVVGFKTYYYIFNIAKFFNNFLNDNDEVLKEWSNEQVSLYLINKSTLYSDLKEVMIDHFSIKFSDIINKFQSLLNDLIEKSLIFDSYNKKVEEELIEDYPWYKYYKKLKVFAQFKISNYKLLNLEKQLNLNNKDYQYLNIDNELYFNHIIYGIPKFSVHDDESFINNRSTRSGFTHLYESIRENDIELTIKWIVIIYDKLRNLDKQVA